MRLTKRSLAIGVSTFGILAVGLDWAAWLFQWPQRHWMPAVAILTAGVITVLVGRGK